MRFFTAILALFLCCGGTALSAAAAERASAYMRAVVTSPLWSGDPLTIRLEPDEQACKKAYGKNWREMCAAAPGQSGAPVRGLRMAPEMSGQWRWQDGTTLNFSPETPWPADTAFTVDMAAVPLPGRVRLTPTALRVLTPPLAARVSAGQVWIDPQAGSGGKSGEHAVSFELAFTTPPQRDTVQRDLVLRPLPGQAAKGGKAGDTGLKVGPVQFVWGQDGTTCLVKARLLELPGNDAPLELRLPGVAALVRAGAQNAHDEAEDDDASGRAWRVLPKKDVRQSVVVPGASGILRIKKAQLEKRVNASLAEEYCLTLESSLLLRPADVLRALKAVQLPEKQNPEALQPYAWNRAPLLSPEDINKGEPLTLEPLQSPDDAAGTLTFRVPVREGRHVFFHLPAGFGPQGKGGPALARPWQTVLQAGKRMAQLDFLQPGHVLPLGGERRLDIYSSDLKSLHWRAARVFHSGLGMLGMGNSFFESDGSTSQVDMDSISDAVEGEIAVAPAGRGEPQFHSLDLSPLLEGGRGLLRLQLTGKTVTPDGEEQEVYASRTLLVTDMGLVAKKTADGGRAVFVCSLSTGAPVADARVRVLGLNGQPVAEARTNAQGRADVPSLAGLMREKTPSALVVTLEKPVPAGAAGSAGTGIVDMAWLPLEDSSRAVDYSRFPTQGQMSAADGVNAYVFSQRGIFRPGETLHFGALLRRGDWQPLPPDMPVMAVLRDPAERVVMERRFTPGQDGLCEFSWESGEGAPSGRYRLYITLRDTVLGSGVVRVEEFQPDTLAVQATVEPAPAAGWLLLPESTALTGSGEAEVRVALRNLYGLPAVDRRVRGQLAVQAAPLRFAGYEDYTFHDALPYKGEPLTRELAETRTNAQGQAALPLELGRLRGGTLQCRVLVEGFEPGGGRAVSTERTFLASPLRAVLGYRPSGPGTNLAFLPQGQKTDLDFVALDPALKPANPGPLTFSVAERRYVSTLVTDAEGRYGYDETPLEREISSSVLMPQRGPEDPPLRWTVPTQKPGEYLLTVRDGQRQVMARIPFTVAGNDDLRPATARTLPSSVLRMHMEKTDYAPGDTVRVFISAPYDGVGLITLERDSVAAHAWFHAKAGNSVQNIVIPPSFEGRAYVNVSLARSLASPDIFMQPHSYALAPITVNTARRDMGLSVTAPELTRPGQPLTATVTARTPGRAVIFAVDEGVLSLTRFATPDPLRHLLLDRALEVDTRQMFDLLMPDHAQLRRRIPAFGGDMDMAGGRFSNPFKRRGEPPLAWWSAPVDVGPQGVSVTIPVPAWYSGQVRVMAVGATPATAGSAQAPATVRGPLTLTPQLPLMAAPGDSFAAALAIGNNETTDQTLTLAVEADPALRLDGKTPERVTVAAGGEAVVPLRVTAAALPGNAALRFRVTDGQGRVFTREASLSLRPAGAARESMAAGTVTGPRQLETARQLLVFDAQGSASVSPLPLPALRGLYRYLKTYPYGCVEQRVSRALPQVLLLRHPGLPLDADTSDAARKEASRTIEGAAQAVQAALDWQGVAPWPDGAEGYEMSRTLLTAYAGDYVLAMRAAGLALPGDLENTLFDALQRCVSGAPETLAEARAQAYAIWVLTRSGRITTPQLEQLGAALNERFTGWRGDIMAPLMAGSLSIMRMDAQARRLLEGFTLPGADFTPEGFMDLPAAQALSVAVLARHFPDRLGAQADALAQRLLESLNSQGYSTFSAAQGMRALLALADSKTAQGDGGKTAGAAQDSALPAALAGVSLTCTAMQPGFNPLPADTRAVLRGGMITLDAPGCASFALTMPETAQPLYWEVSSRGYDRQPPREAAGQGMDVTRRYLDAEGRPVTTARQGDTLTVELSARAHGNEVVDAVLVDLLPGGFEMLLDELTPASGVRMDRREDRMLVFLPLGNDPQVMRYRIRAVNKGAYTLPPFQGEGMYARSVQAHTAGGAITVE